MAFIKIDGVSVPCPSSFEWGLQDISAADSGRSDNGYMHKNTVAKKRTLSVSWVGTTFSDAKTILNAVAKEYFTVVYPDPLTGSESESRTFYVGDRKGVLKYWWSGSKRFESISFDLIER